MEAFASFQTVLKVAAEFGLVGIVLIMWWIDRKDLRRVLDQYQNDMTEIRQMYKNNVHLVEGYESLAGDLKDVIMMNTQAFTRLDDDIEKNQYCPTVRLKKEAIGEQV